jgi:hypothetical protein
VSDLCPACRGYGVTTPQGITEAEAILDAAALITRAVHNIHDDAPEALSEADINDVLSGRQFCTLPQIIISMGTTAGLTIHALSPSPEAALSWWAGYAQALTARNSQD